MWIVFLAVEIHEPGGEIRCYLLRVMVDIFDVFIRYRNKNIISFIGRNDKEHVFGRIVYA